PTEGGRTQRHSAEIGVGVHDHEMQVEAHLYAVRYRFGLFSDFTFFALDPLHGDGIEQTDDRVTLGGSMRLKNEHRIGELRLTSTFGLEVRSDDVDNALYHQQARTRLSTSNAAHVVESSMAAFLEERALVTPWLSTLAALRVERFQADVDARGGSQH